MAFTKVCSSYEMLFFGRFIIGVNCGKFALILLDNFYSLSIFPNLRPIIGVIISSNSPILKVTSVK